MAKQKLKNRFSPAGIAQYPWLNKPDTKFNPEGAYKVTLVLTDEEFNAPNPKFDGKSLKLLIDSEVRNKFEEEKEAANAANRKKIVETFPYEEDVDEDGELNGNWKLSFKMKANVTTKDGKTFSQKPLIVDSKNTPIDVPVYGGSTVKVKFQIVPYMMKNDKTRWAAGVSLRLLAVQVLELVQGNRDAGFDEEDGYVAEVDEENSFEDTSEAGDGESDDF